jgi:hypothetical protein
MDPRSLLSAAGGGSGGGGSAPSQKSLLGRLGDVFSVHDPRLYDESSLSYQMYLLWTLELLYAVVFVSADVECVPAGVEMVGFSSDDGFFATHSATAAALEPAAGYGAAPLLLGQARSMILNRASGVRPIALADRHVCSGATYVLDQLANTSSTVVCTDFHREFVSINCASELKSRGTVLLLGTFLYLVILGVLLARSRPFVAGINKRVSGIIAKVDAAASAFGTFGGGGGGGGGAGGVGGASRRRSASTARALSSMEEDMQDKEVEITAVAKRFRRYKLACIAYFFIAGVGLTGWLFGIGLNRSRPSLCGYHADVWQPFPPYSGYLCALTRSLTMRLALGAVLIFRGLVLIRLIISVRSLQHFLRARRWREESAYVGIPAPLTSIIEKGTDTLRSFSHHLSDFASQGVSQSKSGLASRGSSSSLLEVPGAESNSGGGAGCLSAVTAAAMRRAAGTLGDAAAAGVAEASRELAAALGIPASQDPTETLAQLAASGGVDEATMRRAVDAGLRRALAAGVQGGVVGGGANDSNGGGGGGRKEDGEPVVKLNF